MNASRAAGLILIVVGAIGLVVGLVYATVAVDKLPSFMGHIANASGHHSKRAVAGLVLGAILVVVGGFLVRPKPSPAAPPAE